MPNVNAVLNEQIRRLARREIRTNTKVIKRATGHYRRDIAALKRQVAQLKKLVTTLQKGSATKDSAPPAELIQKARLRIDGLKTHRAKLKLSAKDYGQLMGVSGLTIYNWEAGKSKPRRSHLARIMSVRGIGKREAAERLGRTTGSNTSVRAPKESPPASRKHGRYNQTAEEMILGILSKGKSLSRGEVNSAWERDGRPGTADVMLGRMVKSQKLKRFKARGQTRSQYQRA